MKILIALSENNGINSKLSEHFGHCPYFAILEDEKLEIINNHIDHKSPINPVEQIMNLKPEVIFALGMGKKAIDLFLSKGIKVKTKKLKFLKEVLENLDDLEDLNLGCEH